MVIDVIILSYAKNQEIIQMNNSSDVTIFNIIVVETEQHYN